MDDHKYILSQTTDAFERERLSLLECTADPFSQRWLAALGIQPGWRCLDIGAGHGSMTRWLAKQVGSQGRVVATDINPRFLTEIELPNVEIRQHDIRVDPLESGAYDLAHCRGVLMHMSEPQLVVQRMVESVRVGGWLLIEEVDYSSLRAVDANHPLAESFDQQHRKILERIVQAKLLNPHLGRRVRGLLEGAGLTEINNEGANRIVRGEEAETKLNCMTLQSGVEGGILSQAEYAELQSAFLDPSFSFITVTLFAAWGRRTS